MSEGAVSRSPKTRTGFHRYVFPCMTYLNEEQLDWLEKQVDGKAATLRRLVQRAMNREKRRSVTGKEPSLAYWPFEVNPISPAEIAYAVRDPLWQQFRVSLKGWPTNIKLGMLADYYKKDLTALNYVRVTNYINALRRGGFLDPNYCVAK